MKIAPPIAASLASVFGIRKPSEGDPPESRAFQPSMWPDFLASEPGRPVRVILIDDDPHIRRVIAGELVSDMRIDMVGQADSLRDGRRLISMCEFDVMIVDLNLGDGSGFDLIEHMKQVRPQAEAIVVSIMDDEVRAMRAFELGATGYLVKNSWFGSFTQAVLQVFNGGASITPSLARRLLLKLEQRDQLAMLGANQPSLAASSCCTANALTPRPVSALHPDHPPPAPRCCRTPPTGIAARCAWPHRRLPLRSG